MRMGLYLGLLFVAGMLAVCLFDVLSQVSQEYKRLEDERAKSLSLDVQFKGKR